MHHSSRRLPDQYHGLWGVCTTHPSTPLLSSRVHLQLWNRCSEVPHFMNAALTFLQTITAWIESYSITWLILFSHSITYNGSMESPVPLYPTDCPPPYEAVMGQRAASQVRLHMCVGVCSVCCAHSQFWSLIILTSRPRCMTPTAQSCLEKEGLLQLSVEKVRIFCK